MSHETGSANNLSQLLSRLATFAADLGWVIDKLDTTTPQLYLHNHSGYWSMTGPTLSIYGNTGYNPAALVSEQPGSSYLNNSTSGNTQYQGTRCDELENGNYVSYDFFGTADYLHIAVQIKSNQFRHFGIGTLIKSGEYDGGQYVYGCAFHETSSTYTPSHAIPFTGLTTEQGWGINAGLRYSTVVRADIDSAPHWYIFGRMSGNELRADMCAMGLGDCGLYDSCHPDRLSAQTALSQFGQAIAPVPNIIYIRTLDGIYRQIGRVPDFYVCHMQGVTPRTDITVAGEKWRLIPPLQIQTSTSTPSGESNSLTMGYAFRIIS